MVKKKKENILKLFKRWGINFFHFLGTKTWFLTCLFFGLVLVYSIVIWWQCIYKPQPSVAVLQKIEREKEDFDGMKKETMEAIKLLQNYRENYNKPSGFESQRELFIDVLDVNIKQRIETARKLEEERIKAKEEIKDEEKIVNGDSLEANEFIEIINKDSVPEEKNSE